MAQIGIHYCGLILTVVLLLFSFRGRALKLYSNRIYKLSLIITFFALVFDVISMYALDHFHLLPLLLVDFLCKGYVILTILVACCAFVYVGTSIYTKKSRHYYERIGAIWGAVMIIAVSVLPIKYSLDTDPMFSYGPAVEAAYVLGIESIAIIVIFTLINRKNMSAQTAISVLMWMAAWLITALVQFMIPNMPLIGFGLAMGICIVFSTLESPQQFIDRATGVFNVYAKTKVMDQHFKHDLPFSLLQVHTHVSEKGLPLSVQNNTLFHIANDLSKIPDSQVFIHTNDVFALIFNNETDAYQGIDSINKLFDSPYTVSEQKIFIHPSYTLIPDSRVANNAAEMLLIQNYFEIRTNEGHLNVITDDMVSAVRKEVEVANMINEALLEDRLEIFLQPIYSTEKKIFTSAEALARIRDRDGNIVPPGVFIPVAEKSAELIIKIGERVMHKVCEYIKHNDIKSMGLKYIELNLSVEQCQSPTLAEDFNAIIEKYGIDCFSLSLEITESASITSKDVLLENMNALHDKGILFCLDDFGTGESNLNYVMTMPVDIIKFDRALTQAYFENIRAKFVMDSVITMVQNMDMQVVSEGVETKEQLDTIVDLGIDYVQGFYFSKPLPTDEFTAFIKEHNA